MDAPLYNPEILRLAVSIPHDELLVGAQSRVQRVSPICGSRVTVTLSLDAAGKVCAFGQEVRACALGQASASVLGRHVLGHTAAQIRAAHGCLRDWLQGGALTADLVADWPEIRSLAPARDYPSRHASILLAFDAAAAAAEAAELLIPQG